MDAKLGTPRCTLRYISSLARYEAEPPYELWMEDVDIPASLPRTNVQWLAHDEVPLRDARSHSLDMGLDTTGFCWLRHKSTCLPDLLSRRTGNFSYDEHQMRTYLDEAGALVKQLTCCDEVFVYDWRVLRRVPIILSHPLPTSLVFPISYPGETLWGRR